MVLFVVACQSWSSIGGILVFVATLVACDRSEPEAAPTQAAQPPGDARDKRDAEDDVGADRTAAAADLVWSDAIAAEPEEDGVYVVDSFVAAWLFSRAQTGSVAEWERIDADPDAEPAGGYRLVEIPPGTPYARLGLRTGDVVESLNGVVLSGPDRFGFALDGAESLVIVSVHRDGTSRRLQYQLVAGAAWSRQLADYAGEPDPTVVAQADPTVGADGDDSAGVEPGARTPRSTPPAASPRRPPSGSRGSAAGPAKRPSSKPGASKRPSAISHVRCSSSAKCTIDKAHFQRLVAAPSRLQSQVDVVPAIRNDVFSGYKLKKVRSGSDAARLGFRAGDKITHINGHDLTNDADALALYMSLGSSRLFKIRYERNGRRQVKTVTVA